MTGTLNKVVIFAAGTAIGSAVTWKYVKTKYERIAQEEIDSVKAVFTQRYAEDEWNEDVQENDEPIEVKKSDTPDIREYAEKIQKKKYTSYATPDKEPEVVFDDDSYKAPYVIAPEDFGEIEEYEQWNLTHYSDGTLADDSGNIIEDVEDAVGSDYESHFGDFEDDAVHIRNERLKIDYEILIDPREYSDVINTKTHPSEDE